MRWRGHIRPQTFRLASSLVLFTFLTTHLLNHALGLISLDAMEAGLDLFVAVWWHPLGTWLLVGALATHVTLAFAKLFRRRTFQLPFWEWAQLLLGLAIPLLLARHIVGTRIIAEAYGVNTPYVHVLRSLWPDGALRQTLLIFIAWTHGCIGLHFWLRLKPWYRALTRYLYGVVLLVPILAFLGFATAGRQVAALAADPGWRSALDREVGWPGAAGRAFVATG